MARKKHMSARGREINFDELFLQNKTSIAVTGGGAAMNARGDTLGPGGKVIKTVEEREKISNPQPVEEGTPYHSDNPNAVRQVSVKDNIDNLAALIPETQVKSRALPEDDAFDAKTPEQVINELSQKLEDVNVVAEKDDKPDTKSKRKIVDTDE